MYTHVDTHIMAITQKIWLNKTSTLLLYTDKISVFRSQVGVHDEFHW